MEARVNRKWILGAGIALVLLVAYAWVDGGRQPVHEISQDIPLPGGAK